MVDTLRHDNITIPQGTTFGIYWDLLDGNDPFNPSGWAARAQAREWVDSTTVLETWSTDLGNLDYQGSRLTLYVTPAQSTAWVWSSAYYDIELVQGDLDDIDAPVVRLTQGTLTVDREVTR